MSVASLRGGVGTALDEADELGEQFAHLGILGVGERIDSLLADLVDGLGGLRRERLVTPDAEVLLAWGITLTPRTLDWADGVTLSFTHVAAVDSGEFVRTRLAEDGDVASSGVRSPNPPVVIFEVCLRHALGRQVGGAALPEVSGGDGSVNTSPVSDALEDLRKPAIRQRVVRRVQTTPEWIGSLTRRVTVATE